LYILSSLFKTFSEFV